MNNHELTHHGILGMKWGKRNGPPYPLAPGDHSASEKKAGWRKSLSGNGSNSDRTTGKRERTDVKQNQESRLSDRQKKILMGAAIGTAVGLGIGMAYWYGGRSMSKNLMNSDLVIPAGELIKRISPANEKDLYDRFYAAVGKDASKYKTLYNFQLRKNGVSDIVQKTISSKKELKIAGNDTCAKVFYDLRNHGKINVALGYDDFNRLVPNDRSNFLIARRDFEKFYDELKSMGYDGFIDRNDQSYSNYFAKAPMILFNNSNLSVDSVSSLAPPKVLDLVKEYANIIPRIEAKEAYELGESWVMGKASAGLVTGMIIGAAASLRTADEEKDKNGRT